MPDIIKIILDVFHWLRNDERRKVAKNLRVAEILEPKCRAQRLYEMGRFQKLDHHECSPDLPCANLCPLMLSTTKDKPSGPPAKKNNQKRLRLALFTSG